MACHGRSAPPSPRSQRLPRRPPDPTGTGQSLLTEPQGLSTVTSCHDTMEKAAHIRTDRTGNGIWTNNLLLAHIKVRLHTSLSKITCSQKITII